MLKQQEERLYGEYRTERLVLEPRVRLRVGRSTFRAALDDDLGGRRPLTSITDRALLRGSHFVPWAECKSDGQRLDVINGLLLATH